MGRKKQEKAEEEEKKDGRRDTGVQAKKGWLYILLPRTKVEEGQKVSSKRWVATGLADTDKNLEKAIDMRKSLMSSKNKGLTDDPNVMLVMYVDLPILSSDYSFKYRLFNVISFLNEPPI